MRKDNYGDIYLSEMCWEAGSRPGCFIPNPLSKVCQKESMVPGIANRWGGPGARSARPSWGCPGHSPLNSEALNTGGVDLSHMAPNSY